MRSGKNKKNVLFNIAAFIGACAVVYIPVFGQFIKLA